MARWWGVLRSRHPRRAREGGSDLGVAAEVRRLLVERLTEPPGCFFDVGGPSPARAEFFLDLEWGREETRRFLRLCFA